MLIHQPYCSSFTVRLYCQSPGYSLYNSLAANRSTFFSFSTSIHLSILLGRITTFATLLLANEYMYSFANNNVANVVIRPSNMDKCIEVLKEKKVDLLAASELYKL